MFRGSFEWNPDQLLCCKDFYLIHSVSSSLVAIIVLSFLVFVKVPTAFTFCAPPVGPPTYFQS